MSIDNSISFTWSDAWVLAAIAVGGGMRGAGLKEIVAAGDLINRAIITGPILRCGLAKLMHRGYVRPEAGRFLIAGGAQVAIGRVLERPGTSFSVLQFFEEFLDAAPYPLMEEDHPTWTYAGVSDAQLEWACAQYLAEMAEAKAEAVTR